jgi:hypothetical protein
MAVATMNARPSKTKPTKREVDVNRESSLVRTTFGEIFQTERSAIRHPRVEAERLGDCPPARAMLAVSEHAERAERDLTALAKARGARSHSVGTVVGTMFSAGRNRLADLLLTSQASYRGTLLGIRHGVDAMLLFQMAARVEGDDELAAWCDAWRVARRPLVDDVEKALVWFAEHPALALRPATHKLGRSAAVDTAG